MFREYILMSKRIEILQTLQAEARGIQTNNKNFLCLAVDSNGLTEPCAFCGRRHHHGRGSGHRRPHCFRTILDKPVSPDAEFTNSQGERFRLRDGYILK